MTESAAGGLSQVVVATSSTVSKVAMWDAKLRLRRHGRGQPLGEFSKVDDDSVSYAVPWVRDLAKGV